MEIIAWNIRTFVSKVISLLLICYLSWTSNSEETEVERFYEDLQDLIELTPKNDVLFIIGDWNAKVGHPKTNANQIFDT